MENLYSNLINDIGNINIIFFFMSTIIFVLHWIIIANKIQVITRYSDKAKNRTLSLDDKVHWSKAIKYIKRLIKINNHWIVIICYSFTLSVGAAILKYGTSDVSLKQLIILLAICTIILIVYILVLVGILIRDYIFYTRIK